MRGAGETVTGEWGGMGRTEEGEKKIKLPVGKRTGCGMKGGKVEEEECCDGIKGKEESGGLVGWCGD